MEEKIQDSFSLFKTLETMADYDNEIGNVTIEAFEKAANGQKPVVDSEFKFILILESRIDAIDKEIKSLQGAKKSIQNTIKNHGKYLDYTMKKFDIKKLQGNLHTLYRQERTNIEFTKQSINSDIYLELNLLRPDTVKQEYKLDKTAFKKLCEKNPEILEKYGKQTTTSFTMFKTRKGV